MSRRKASTTRNERLPVLPLRSTVVYPLGVVGVHIGMSSTLEMLSAHAEPGLLAAMVVAPGGPDDPIDPRALEKIGVAVRLSDRLNLPGGTVQATIQGLQRIRLADVTERGGSITAQTRAVREKAAPEREAQDLIARIVTALEALAAEVERIPREVPRILRMNLGDPGRFADLVATLANFSVSSKDEILQRLNVRDRLAYAAEELEQQLRRLRQLSARKSRKKLSPAGGPVGGRATELRQQIKALQSELGEIDPLERETIELLRRVEVADLPARVGAQARAEIERLRAVGGPVGDVGDIRGYVDWLLHMPWRRRAAPGPTEIDLTRVQQELDEEILGLDEQKQRLLDYLAVAKLRGDLWGAIPCLVGPPDVGKTTLVAAIARGLDRPLARLGLGGRSEAQLAGSRRTRSGAQPGRIAAALRAVGVRDPVFLLEELDEVGEGKVEGDPVEAMEELLDRHTRSRFRDRYLDLDFDLGDAILIGVAQDFHRIPRSLQENLLEIRIAGYTPEEKVDIARQRMLPRLIREHGLEPGDVSFPAEALSFLAYSYARDAGTGALQRSLETMLRTRARAKAQGDASAWAFSPERIEEILGVPRYVATPAESTPEVGVVTGLAWTAVGGELMFIEALRMPGTGRLIITGSLGEVMRESVNAAYSYVRNRGDRLRIDEEDFRESDVHVHFPVGAIPKDGPSAGIAVTLAIASCLSNRAVRHDIAMTGEVTLRGKVLEVGGVKEKVLAAHRAGLAEVILPRGNERDLRDVPANVRDAIRFHFVQAMDDVIKLAFFRGRGKRRSGSRGDGVPPQQVWAAEEKH